MSSLKLENMESSDIRRLDAEQDLRPINQQTKFKRDNSSPAKKVSKFPIFARNDSLEEINSPTLKDKISSYHELIDRSNARESDLINEQ